MAEKFKSGAEGCSEIVSLDSMYDELDSLLSLYERFSQIIDAHLNDFFSSNLWERTSEQRCLLTSQLSYKCEGTTADYRDHLKLPSCCSSRDQESLHCRYCLKEERKLDDEIKADPAASTNANKFLTQKKEHEVLVLSDVINKISKDAQCKKVVDFGSGKGYLCQHMTNIYELEVLGIEMSNDCSTSAEKRVEKMKRADGKTNQERYKTATYKINETTIKDSKMFVNFVHQQFSSESRENKYILTGLHACGDLTSYAVQLFVKEEAFEALCIIGCCYNLITELGFPLSSTLRRKQFRIGKQAKFLACQCPIRWKETNQVLNESLLYRAILEKIFTDKEIKRNEIEHIKFRRIGKKANSFVEYMTYVRAQHPPLDGLLPDAEQNEYYERYSKQWLLMQEFHWIRMQLGPLVEKLILFDRMCYMRDQGLQNACIVRLFDPVISPRCYALICTKESIKLPH